MTKAANLHHQKKSRARRSEAMLTLFLVNGFQIRGTIGGFDAFTVIVNSDGKQNLIYKHAISTITPLRALELEDRMAGEQ